MEVKDLLSIAHTYGSPVYVYDANKISAQYERLTKAFAAVPSLRINYAMKALSNVSVLKLMRKLGAGLDTVSLQEVRSPCRFCPRTDYLHPQWGLYGGNRGGGFSGSTAQYRQPFHLGTIRQQTPTGTCMYPHQSTCYGWGQLQDFSRAYR